jgi:hypothetical protein
MHRNNAMAAAAQHVLAVFKCYLLFVAHADLGRRHTRHHTTVFSNLPLDCSSKSQMLITARLLLLPCSCAPSSATAAAAKERELLL